MATCIRPELWEHQRRGIDQTVAAFEAGEDRVCLTGPTGSGKTRTAAELMEWALNRGQASVFYTNRRLLLEQMCRFFDALGIEYGVRAAGFDDLYKPHEPIQIASTQTEHARAYQRSLWKPHEAQLVIFDELHLQKGNMAGDIMARHDEEHSSRFVGLTATPLGVHERFPKLIVAGTMSECRQTGALVPCHVYGPTEFDMRNVERTGPDGEYSLEDVRKRWTTKIFGHVLDHWKRLNPEQRPTVLFAPGVAESVWFAEQFEAAGVKAAHIDGADLYVDRERSKTDREGRERILARVRDGDIKVITNRFVCREGIDLPELYCAILATPIGSLVSYLQAVGRVLRSHSSMDHVVLIDHGGNWHRHGSPNLDRDWADVFTMQPRVITDLRIDRIRERIVDPATGKLAEPEPRACPMCGRIRTAGTRCPNPECGYISSLRTRRVLQADGQLVDLTGDIYKPRYTRVKSTTQDEWENCYWRCFNSGRTFRQAYGLFYYEHGYLPPRDMKRMPLRDLDWYRNVDQVAAVNLR